MKGGIICSFSGWTFGKYLSASENFNFFCRNSWVLKLLAHEMSDEFQKKIKILVFYGKIKWGIIYSFSGWTLGK